MEKGERNIDLPNLLSDVNIVKEIWVSIMQILT